jgi:hypothetical protein
LYLHETIEDNSREFRSVRAGIGEMCPGPAWNCPPMATREGDASWEQDAGAGKFVAGDEYPEKRFWYWRFWCRRFSCRRFSYRGFSYWISN